MSTDLYAFLNYMSAWTAGSEEEIQTLIDEHNLFVSLGDFDSETAIQDEFDKLTELATEVRDTTIAADVMKILADGAIASSIWSFGLSMAAFAVLETTAAVMQSEVSSKSEELFAKMETIDTDISTRIDPKVYQYIAAYKANNDMIAAKQAKGMDGQTVRSILLQFMGKIEVVGDKLDVATFQKWADSAKRLFNSDQVNAVYDALDELNLSDKSDDDLSRCFDSIAAFESHDNLVVTLVRLASLFIMANRMKIANERLVRYNEEAELVGAETKTSAFEMMDAWGKFSAGIAVIASVADAVLQILDIKHVVEQSNRMLDELKGPIKKSYQDYFAGIRDAADRYNQAMAAKTG